MASGFLLHHYTWPVVFYFWGFIAVIWFILFVSIPSKSSHSYFCQKLTFFLSFQSFLCYSYPGSHPFISRQELEYLETEIGQTKRHDDLPPTPWVSIITSGPMIALIFAQVS